MPDEEGTKAPNLTNEQKKILNSKRVNMEVSLYESVIIQQLRKMSFGQLTIHLLEGVPIRYTIGQSVAIDPTGDIELLKEVVKSTEKGG